MDKCLPFGASISCAHFQKVSDAIAYLVEYRTNKPVVNYLDNYLFAALLKRLCNWQVTVFLQTCQRIGLPVSQEKTFYADTLLTFLGLLIDTINQIVGIPLDKLSKGRNMIAHILGKKNMPKSKCKMTIHQLQKICGFLNFLCQAIVLGRAFTRRFYSHLRNNNLRPHHYIRVSDDMMQDLDMWNLFLR